MIVGQQRPDGTALVIEDVCFPPDRVAEGAAVPQGMVAVRVAGAATPGDEEEQVVGGISE
jgi:hypothetical protein